MRERERERERERDTEKDGSDVTIFALKLAMSFALFLAKNLHLSIGEEFCTFPCQKFAPQFLPSRMALSSHFPLPKTLQTKGRRERKRKGRERKRKGKGEREIGSEALAETEKIANAPAGNRTRDPSKRG